MVVLENLTKGLRQSEDDKTIKGNPKIILDLKMKIVGILLKKIGAFCIGVINEPRLEMSLLNKGF